MQITFKWLYYYKKINYEFCNCVVQRNQPGQKLLAEYLFFARNKNLRQSNNFNVTVFRVFSKTLQLIVKKSHWALLDMTSDIKRD